MNGNILERTHYLNQTGNGNGNGEVTVEQTAPAAPLMSAEWFPMMGLLAGVLMAPKKDIQNLIIYGGGGAIVMGMVGQALKRATPRFVNATGQQRKCRYMTHPGTGKRVKVCWNVPTRGSTAAQGGILMNNGGVNTPALI